MPSSAWPGEAAVTPRQHAPVGTPRGRHGPPRTPAPDRAVGVVPAGPPRLDRTFAALAHPARRAILARLAHGRASVTELAAPLAMSQPAVSKHLKVLEEAGLITRGRDAQRRPCELRRDALDEVDEWVGAFRRTWEERLDRLDTYLRQTRQAASPADAGAPGHERTTEEDRHD